MNCIQVYIFREDQKAVHFADASDAWGGAFTIWKTLANKYKLPFELTKEKIGPIWRLVRCSDVPRFEKLTIISTFEGVWIKRDHIPALVNALRDFCDETLSNHGGVLTRGTLDRLSAILLLAISDETIRGVAFNQIDSAKSFWQIEEASFIRPYDLFKDKGHFEIMEELASYDQGEGS